MNPQYGTALAQAAAQQQNLGGSPNSGQGNDPHIQNLQNLAQIDFKAGNVGNAMGAYGGAASNAADLEAAARQAAEASARYKLTLKAKQMEKDQALNDPKNYIRQVSADGGYNFYKPDGTPISVGEYSRATGKQIPDALSGSQSKGDLDFIKDYKQLITYGKAMAGDDDALKKFTESNDGKVFLSNKDNKNRTYMEVVTAFRNNYSKYMQPGQTPNVPSTGINGRDIRDDIAGGSQAGMLSDIFNGRRNNVTYRG